MTALEKFLDRLPILTAFVLFHVEAADGISGIGGVHPSASVKSVSRVNQVSQSETSDAAAAVTRTHGPKRDTFQSDFSSPVKAVRGGDIAGAQAALGQLELDVRSTGPHGDHASLQGQIHGRGHGRGHAHQGSNLLAAVAAAFQSQTSTPASTTTPVA